MIIPNSLAATLDAINETLFDDRSLSKTQMEEAAKWIVGRQYTSGKHAGMFAPTELDHKAGIRLFTGEKLKTKLATRNVLTAQAAWALALLDAGVQDALERANRWLFRQCFSHSCTTGECAHSAVGLMRYLAVARLADSERRLAAHIEVLSRQRDGTGRWKRFPFYYTLLTLAEINLPSAVEELHYAVPACERVLRRSSQDNKFSRRRRAIVQRALARC